MEDFTWEEENVPTGSQKTIKNSAKIVFTVAGEKGEGKTTFAMGLPGRIYTINYDGKALRVKDGMYANDKRLTVLDGKKYIKHLKIETYTEECERTVRWLMFLLDEIEKKGDCDWIHIDASDYLTKILEMKMRFKEHIGVFQGVTNRGAWNLRTFDLRMVHNRALTIARYGIVYTTFRELISVETEEEEVSKYIPKWSSVIKEETDVYVVASEKMTRDRNNKLQTKFFVTVVSSKIPALLKTGEEFEITNNTITRWLKDHFRFKYFNRFGHPVKIKKLKSKKKNLLD